MKKKLNKRPYYLKVYKLKNNYFAVDFIRTNLSIIMKDPTEQGGKCIFTGKRKTEGKQIEWAELPSEYKEIALNAYNNQKK